MRAPEWEPIPQRKPIHGAQDELRIEIPPEEPASARDKEKPRYEMGEDITPANHKPDDLDEDVN